MCQGHPSEECRKDHLEDIRLYLKSDFCIDLDLGAIEGTMYDLSFDASILPILLYLQLKLQHARKSQLSTKLSPQIKIICDRWLCSDQLD